MDKAALQAVTGSQLADFVANPSHALCLIGPPGAGKAYVAELVAAELLGPTTAEATYRIGNEQNSIGIDEVRALQGFLKLKKAGDKAIRRVVIIENAQNMGDEAQNALLKTLEEPPEDTLFILTTDGSAGLKSTIYSRVQSIRLLALDKDTANTHFTGKDFDKAYHLSGGYAGLLHALLNDPDHQLVTAVEEAKQLIQAKPFERLVKVDRLAKQKDQLPMLFYALQRVLGAILPRTTDSSKLKRLTANMRAIYEAELDLGKSANPKLLLSDLFLQL